MSGENGISFSGVDVDVEGAVSTLALDSPLLESCQYVASSPGKRVRAGMLFSAARYGPGSSSPLVPQAAVAVELFHAATLAHDDVVDDGQLRRGRPTIGAYAGNLAASLSGGWLFARAVELIADLGPRAAARFAETAATVCEGEMLESLDLHDLERSEDRYLEVIYAKTASLMAFATWLGGAVAGAGQGQLDGLEEYGRSVGMAFQIADDILDLLADAQVTGKTPGSDLRQGVYTLPVIRALRRDPSLRLQLANGPEGQQVGRLVEQIRAIGAVESALASCRDWVVAAEAALPAEGAATEHHAHLVLLAGSVLVRAEELAVA